MELKIQKIHANELLKFWETFTETNPEHFPISLKRINSFRNNPHINVNPVLYLGF